MIEGFTQPRSNYRWKGTIASNIAYGASETPREEIERAARQANCDFIWDMKDGFDTKSECARRVGSGYVLSVFLLQLDVQA